MKNKFNLNDIVSILKHNDKYKIVRIELDTYNKSKSIWYHIYRISDGYVCVVKEGELVPIEE